MLNLTNIWIIRLHAFSFGWGTFIIFQAWLLLQTFRITSAAFIRLRRPFEPFNSQCTILKLPPKVTGASPSNCFFVVSVPPYFSDIATSCQLHMQNFFMRWQKFAVHFFSCFLDILFFPVTPLIIRDDHGPRSCRHPTNIVREEIAPTCY